MAEQKKPDDSLSPQEMRRWLSEEIADLAKALQLRVTEASALVTAFTSGEISAAQAEKRLQQYDRRWGEALPGASAAKGVTDEEILAAVDRATMQQNPGTFQRRLATRQRRPGPEEPLR